MSLDHFQRLCASSLSLLRANVANAADGSSPPPATAHVLNATRAADHARAVPLARNVVQEAGELLAAAASRWAAADVESVCAADCADAEAPLISLFDEIHRLRLQLSMQHVRVINSYAEGLKQFTSQQRTV